MDGESWCLPLDYLQGHKDGLEWAAQLAEANHPEKGDWLYDDPIELAKAIRKGPDMPPAQPVADSEPVAYTDERNLGYIDRGREAAYLWGKQNSEASDVALYAVPQPEQVVPEEATPDSIEILASARRRDHAVFQWDEDQRNAAADSWNSCRAAMLQAGNSPAQSDCCPAQSDCCPAQSDCCPAQSDCCPAQNHVSPEQNSVAPAQSQGWIQVSERMPESNGVYFGWDGKRVLEVYCFFGGFSANQFIHGEITHWMPLPAAPQEVNHG
ncbi:DUF551 domain-containing protein [Klebsiella variicola]|nr:DUF551 domain-containing protein [Klebsiella variicola]MBZ6575059.1 DUF551 domain-containing protein [Klebsiella variicola]MBZ7584162.1 DUF551 domain-containing protein [Klebsiella variicola]